MPAKVNFGPDGLLTVLWVQKLAISLPECTVHLRRFAPKAKGRHMHRCGGRFRTGYR